MFMRNIALCVIILCIASLFVGLPFAEAHPTTEEFVADFKEAEQDRDTALRQQVKWRNRHTKAKAIVDDLLGKWDGNEAAIKDGTWEVVDTMGATLIAEIIRQTNNDEGKSSTQQMIEALPTLYGIYQSWKSTAETAEHRANRDKYLSALSIAVGALNEIISSNKAAFNDYDAKYDVYVELMQNHAGGLARVANHSSSGDYNSVTAWSLATIKATVKDKNAYNITDSLNMLMFWYHPSDLKSTSQPSSHSFDRFNNFDDFWKLTPLLKNKDCGGDCGQQFQTPVEHLVVCPHPLTVSFLRGENGNVIVRNLPLDAGLPQGKAAPAGCGDAYYLCSSGDREEHKIRICGKKLHGGGRCNIPYRNCNNSWFKHGRFVKSKHSEKRSGLIIDSLDGLLNAAPGDSHTAELTASNPYTSVKWYVKSPSETGGGTLIETDDGDGSSTTASLAYTFQAA